MVFIDYQSLQRTSQVIVSTHQHRQAVILVKLSRDLQVRWTRSIHNVPIEFLGRMWPMAMEYQCIYVAPLVWSEFKTRVMQYSIVIYTYLFVAHRVRDLREWMLYSSPGREGFSHCSYVFSNTEKRWFLFTGRSLSHDPRHWKHCSKLGLLTVVGHSVLFEKDKSSGLDSRWEFCLL